MVENQLVVISSTGGLGAWITGVARIPYVIGIDSFGSLISPLMIGAMATGAVFISLAAGGIWAWTQYGSETEFTPAAMMPDVSTFSTLTFFATMTFAFAGLELGPIMSGEIKDPKRSIPQAA